MLLHIGIPPLQIKDIRKSTIIPSIVPNTNKINIGRHAVPGVAAPFKTLSLLYYRNIGSSLVYFSISTSNTAEILFNIINKFIIINNEK